VRDLNDPEWGRRKYGDQQQGRWWILAMRSKFDLHPSQKQNQNGPAQQIGGYIGATTSCIKCNFFYAAIQSLVEAEVMRAEGRGKREEVVLVQSLPELYHASRLRATEKVHVVPLRAKSCLLWITGSQARELGSDLTRIPQQQRESVGRKESGSEKFGGKNAELKQESKSKAQALRQKASLRSTFQYSMA
jgi:hypothetical protein